MLLYIVGYMGEDCMVWLARSPRNRGHTPNIDLLGRILTEIWRRENHPAKHRQHGCELTLAGALHTPVPNPSKIVTYLCFN